MLGIMVISSISFGPARSPGKVFVDIEFWETKDTWVGHLGCLLPVYLI